MTSITRFETPLIEPVLGPIQGSPQSARCSAENARLLEALDELSRRIVELEDRNLELESKYADLEVKNASLLEFTTTAAHDLRSPITTIQGLSWLAKRNLRQGQLGAAEEDLTQIESVCRRMTALLDDQLLLARQNCLLGERTPVDLGEVAREAREQCAGVIAERGVDVVVRRGLPVVLADRGRLLQVFQNLIDNAVRYMGEQPLPRIEISSHQRRGEVLCVVRDNGSGIDPRHHETVFESSVRLFTEVEGSGLGLALARRVVEAHGGRLWVDSEGAGRGSSFCFTLASAGP